MFPAIPPGSLVVIDDSKAGFALRWTASLTGPSIFWSIGMDTRAVGARERWKPDRAAASGLPVRSRSVRYPEEIEVIGQVTRVRDEPGEKASQRRPRSG